MTEQRTIRVRARPSPNTIGTLEHDLTWLRHFLDYRRAFELGSYGRAYVHRVIRRTIGEVRARKARGW